MKTILVTGATGFLGGHIVRQLFAEGHRIRCIVRNATKVKQLLDHHPQLVFGDLTDARVADEGTRGIDAVVHSAALLGGWGKDELFLRNNLDATRNLLDSALRHGVKRFVYVSSATSYGLQPGVRLTEESPTHRERDPYCETKLLCEELLRAHAGQEGLQVTILRPSIIYGPYDYRFLPPVVENIKKGAMIAIGERNQGPPLVYAKDVARFVAAIHDNQTTPFEIFNLSSPEQVSWERIIEEVATALNVPPRVRRIPFRLAYAAGGVLEFFWKAVGASEPPILTRFIASLIGLHYHFDSSKALSVPGFDGFTPFSIGLAETLYRMDGGIGKNSEIAKEINHV